MGRAPCCDKANVKKGPWSPEEDAKLKAYIEEHGTGGNWIALPQKIGLKRCGKSCRLRWLNYLRPNIKHGGFSEEEDQIICSLYISIGSRWSIIAAQLPGRTDNDIKNYWNTRLKKKLLGRRREQPQSRRLSVKRNTQVEADATSHNSSDSQVLNASALERIQLHMQLQGLSHPFSLYNNPLLWSGYNPLPDSSVFQSQHIDANAAATPLQQASMEPIHQAMLPISTSGSDSMSAEIHSVFENSNFGFGQEQSSSNFESMATDLQAELHDLLHGKNELECFKQANVDKDNMNYWWSNDGLVEKSSPSSWESGPGLQPDTVIQEYMLPYDL